jgi:hypothetical protein
VAFSLFGAESFTELLRRRRGIRHESIGCGIRRLTSTTASGPVDDNSAAAMGSFSNSSARDQALLFAGGAMAMMPRLVVFAVLQPSFIQALTVGACIERLVPP